MSCNSLIDVATTTSTSVLANGVIPFSTIHLDKSDFYAIANMVYSDYYNPRFDTNTYVQLAIDWLDDKDVGGNKTLKYYMKVVK